MVLTSEYCGFEQRKKHLLAVHLVGETQEDISELQFQIFNIPSLLGQRSLLSFVLWKSQGLQI